MTNSATSVTEPSSGSANAGLTFTLSAPSTAPVTVYLATTAPGGSLVTSGTDFTPPPASIVIPAGVTTFTYDIPVAADGFWDDGEQFTVSIAGTSVEVGESNEVVYQLTLSRPSEYAAGLTLNVDGPATTATLPGDADLVGTIDRAGGPFTIAAGEIFFNVSLVVAGDGDAEADEVPTEVLDLGLIANYGGAELAADGVNVTATITNDDAAVVTMAAGTAAATEPGSGTVNVPITVTMDTTASYDVVVDVATSVSSGSLATGGTDFTVETTTVTIPAGSTSAVYNAVVAADAWYDGGETFDVKLTGTSTPGVSVGVADTTVVTIADSGPAPVLTVSVADGGTTGVSGDGTSSISLVALEGGTGTTNEVVLTTSLSRPAEHPTQVVVEIDPASTAVLPDDAAILDSVTRGSSPLTIPAYATEYNVSVVVSGDSELEPDHVLDFGLVGHLR
ncbi:uncharacterized protein AMSG_02433 [Thecamonas trahens ATCC 50062]|uniref:Calx-beta domain-containing protein n=1 Tax=Thecamonas trahens ATCC 50062 TaxID=461836 RepID=A0A0L0DW68_THETB|nr:hypothetical protein AMSG_02433 [Thecamonas trahens ATCC 50062]KNC56465.1 hypothetical protein AMSG_02433 [Thecamonas trahens ATCC 50062]|eukprot:XP_013760974.1 hypothetical protein AMSG_02433 [Thecamonas trahens ATCC 50062]